MQHIPCRRRMAAPSASPSPATPQTETMDAKKEDVTCHDDVPVTLTKRAIDRFKRAFDWMMG